jgi:hypothetical protein
MMRIRKLAGERRVENGDVVDVGIVGVVGAIVFFVSFSGV